MYKDVNSFLFIHLLCYNIALNQTDVDSQGSDEFLNEVIRQIDLIDESEIDSFEEILTITSDISTVIKDLKQFNENVIYSITQQH